MVNGGWVIAVYRLTEDKNKKTLIVPVWTDSAYLKPIAKAKNPFIIHHALQGKFIVIYSGNLAYTHNVEALAEIAALIRNPGIIFLIIGEGDSRESLSARIKELGLNNCKMLPWQPASELPFSLAAADLIVSSGGGASNLSIPGKTFNMMFVGAPLLCLASEGSELEKLVYKHQNGRCFSHEKIEEIAAFINNLANNDIYHNTLIDNSLKASKEYSPENAKRFLE